MTNNTMMGLGGSPDSPEIKNKEVQAALEWKLTQLGANPEDFKADFDLVFDSAIEIDDTMLEALLNEIVMPQVTADLSGITIDSLLADYQTAMAVSPAPIAAITPPDPSVATPDPTSTPATPAPTPTPTVPGYPATGAMPATPDPTSTPATPDPASTPATPDPTSTPATPDPTSTPATPDPTSTPATPDPTSTPATPDPTSTPATPDPASTPTTPPPAPAPATPSSTRSYARLGLGALAIAGLATVVGVGATRSCDKNDPKDQTPSTASAKPSASAAPVTPAPTATNSLQPVPVVPPIPTSPFPVPTAPSNSKSFTVPCQRQLLTVNCTLPADCTQDRAQIAVPAIVCKDGRYESTRPTNEINFGQTWVTYEKK